MGKVASTALAEAIADQITEPVYHLHFLSKEGIAFADSVYRSNWDSARLPWHVWESKRIRRMLRQGGTEPWKVATVVRDPVSRNVSSFFQTAFLQHRLDVTALSTEQLRTEFLETFDEHDRPLNWLDKEVDAVFGTDLYANDFPQEAGWAVVSSPMADVAVIRYEDLETAAAPAVDALLGVQLPPLGRSNSSSTKQYGDAHRSLVDSLTLPDAYLDMMYESKYAKHFYSDEERAKFRERWI